MKTTRRGFLKGLCAVAAGVVAARLAIADPSKETKPVIPSPRPKKEPQWIVESTPNGMGDDLFREKYLKHCAKKLSEQMDYDIAKHYRLGWHK